MAESPLFVNIKVTWLNFRQIDVGFCRLAFSEGCKSISFTILSKLRFFDVAFTAWIWLHTWENAAPCHSILKLRNLDIQALCHNMIIWVVTEIGRFLICHKLIDNWVFTTNLFYHFDVDLTWSVLACNARHQLRVEIPVLIGITNHPVSIPLFLCLNVNQAFFLYNILVVVVLQVLRADVVKLWDHVLAGCVVVKQDFTVVREQLVVFNWAGLPFFLVSFVFCVDFVELTDVVRISEIDLNLEVFTVLFHF